MRSCRKAEAPGKRSVAKLPEAIKPFLNVLAEMLAESVVRERIQRNPIQRVKETDSLNCAPTDLQYREETPSK